MGLFELTLTSCFGFLLAFYAGLFIMLSLAELSKNAGFSTLSFESTKSTVK